MIWWIFLPAWFFIEAEEDCVTIFSCLNDGVAYFLMMCLTIDIGIMCFTIAIGVMCFLIIWFIVDI